MAALSTGNDSPFWDPTTKKQTSTLPCSLPTLKSWVFWGLSLSREAKCKNISVCWLWLRGVMMRACNEIALNGDVVIASGNWCLLAKPPRGRRDLCLCLLPPGSVFFITVAMLWMGASSTCLQMLLAQRDEDFSSDQCPTSASWAVFLGHQFAPFLISGCWKWRQKNISFELDGVTVSL